MKTIEQTKVEQISADESEFSLDVQPSVAVGGADELQDTLADMADTFDVTGFKCVKCGLVHKHDTTKHRLSDSFDISEDDTASTEYNSVCHCGLQEAARHGSDFGVNESRASVIADSAPIPPEAAREMNEQYGAL